MNPPSKPNNDTEELVFGHSSVMLSTILDDVFLSIGPSKLVDGVKTQRFRKAIVRVGQFFKKSSNQTFTVTAAILSHWVETFKAMKKNGVEVSIPNTHRGAGNADQTRGYVKKLFVEGDRLIMIADMIGEDGIGAANRNDVSIFSPPEFTDGLGNKYLYPIKHVALTPEPLVPGLGTFVPIAASHDKGDIPMDWTGLEKELGISGVTDEKATTTIVAAFNEIKADAAKQIDELGVKVKALESGSKDDKVPKAEKRDVSKNELTMSIENRKMKLDKLMDDGAIDPSTCKALADQYIGVNGGTLLLSLQEDRDDGFSTLVATLATNKPVQLGEQSGAQLDTIALHDELKESKVSPLVEDMEERAKAAKEFSGMHAIG